MNSLACFGLNENTINKICHVFEQHPDIEQVIIYGSRAKGTFRNGSDIDLTIISSEFPSSNLMKLNVELDDLNLPYTIDLSLKRQIEEKALLEHIKNHGQVFFDQNKH